MCPPLSVIQSRLQALSERLQGDFHVTALHVFGSVARDEAGPDSDLDVLVDFADTPTFARFMDLKFLLEDEFGVRVDLVTRAALREPIKARILAEARRVA
jgi:predicted nucleotidyltransferase